jgi:putative SOS response-associated peptidase YedK
VVCNLYSQTSSVDGIRQFTKALGLELTYPEGAPNLQPGEIAISDMAPLLRVGQAGHCELVVRRWSWPGPGGKPVYNFRSDGREFATGRCLILTTGFYEFTKPEDAKQKRKNRWLFTMLGEPLIGIAGLVREAAGIGEAFTMLTTEPGADVAPFHQRQVAVLPSGAWQSWLDYSQSAGELIRPLPQGSLSVQAANRVD